MNTATGGIPREAFDRLLGDLRPKLHRYSARMTGSVIDGEDVLQDALVKALEAFDRAGPSTNPEGWLFSIAHNAALDFLRRRAVIAALQADVETDLVADPSTVGDREAVAASLRSFMHLPVNQRSSVILMDVLGYSLADINSITGSSIAAIKTALHRGRARLRELAATEDPAPALVLTEPERSRLAAYVERFNARDFDAIRDMLAEDVRLDLVARKRADGRSEVASYFSNYGRARGWRLILGSVDGRPALLVHDPDDPSGRMSYFILLEWDGDRIRLIRDFAHARYAIEGADLRRPS
jgi:RNA polymerase sigma-70 factor (ECF subfamily)